MADPDQIRAGNYQLPLPSQAIASSETAPGYVGISLPESMLANNVLWFCQLRWMIIAFLVVFGILGQFEGLTRYAGLRSLGFWPFIAAGLLILCNVSYLGHARRAKSSTKQGSSLINLWIQVVLDLLILTAVVHFMGSVRTYVPFAYLFHIVLACVFLSRRQSLVVLVLASVLFAACITVENLGILPPADIFLDGGTSGEGVGGSGAFVLSFPSAIVIWLVIWYLMSNLTASLRRRDLELAQTNRRLVAAQQERSQHMLTMTHQLKAPFAAVHANAQLLLRGHCGDLSDKATEVMLRIAARCNRLAREIQEMLQLANLSSISQQPPISVDLDLADVIKVCIEQARPSAQKSEVTLEVDLSPAPVNIVEDHLKMLIENLISNAVNYSHTGGCVRVKCGSDSSSESVVSIADEGIGISAEILPPIFEEHYRTKEAAKFNKESSGLGLAIVKHVAEMHNVQVSVASEPEVGTIFKLRFVRSKKGSSASR